MLESTLSATIGNPKPKAILSQASVRLWRGGDAKTVTVPPCICQRLTGKPEVIPREELPTNRKVVAICPSSSMNGR